MFLAFLAASAVCCVFNACFLYVLVRLYCRERDRLIEKATSAVRDFISSPDADTPSALGVVLDQFALLLSARVAQQIKAMLAGMESGASKRETAEVEATVLQGHPWLQILSSIIPKRIKNQLLRNPQMVGALSNLGGNHSPGTTESPGSQSSFSL